MFLTFKSEKFYGQGEKSCQDLAYLPRGIDFNMARSETEIDRFCGKAGDCLALNIASPHKYLGLLITVNKEWFA